MCQEWEGGTKAKRDCNVRSTSENDQNFKKVTNSTAFFETFSNQTNFKIKHHCVKNGEEGEGGTKAKRDCNVGSTSEHDK